LKWVAPVVAILFRDNITASQRKASAAHIRVWFDNRHFELGVAQQISRTEPGDTGTKYNDMLSLANALIELRRSGIGPRQGLQSELAHSIVCRSQAAQGPHAFKKLSPRQICCDHYLSPAKNYSGDLIRRAFGMLSANTAIWNPDGSFIASRWMLLLAE